MVRDVNTVRVNEEACQRRFDAFSRLKFVSFFSFSRRILSRQILSLVRSFSLSFSLLLLLLSPDDDHLSVL